MKNTHHRKRTPKARAAAAVVTALAGAWLCVSCTTPPSRDDGLVGIIYHAAARPEPVNWARQEKPTVRPEPRVSDAPPAAPMLPVVVSAAAAEPTPAPAVPHVPGPDGDFTAYRISPGDVLAASYFVRPNPDLLEYLVDSQDVLTLSVAGQETYTADVTVRPDGCISFFLIGEMRVRGLTVAQVRSSLGERLARVMPGAEITVILRSGNAMAREFLDTLRSNTDLGSTRIMQVRHDGAVTFPLVGEVVAMGRTLRSLSAEVESRYNSVFRGGISVSLNLNSSSDGNIAVLGEVRNPGRYTIGNPVSPFFALAMAGGALDTARKSQVVVVKRRPGGRPSWHVVNLDLDASGPLGPEIALAPQDMLLVPKSGVANLNRFVDQYIRRMMPVPTGFGFSYDLNP